MSTPSSNRIGRPPAAPLHLTRHCLDLLTRYERRAGISTTRLLMCIGISDVQGLRIVRGQTTATPANLAVIGVLASIVGCDRSRAVDGIDLPEPPLEAVQAVLDRVADYGGRNAQALARLRACEVR